METLVTFNPITIGLDDSLTQVMRLMDEYELHHVPVVDDQFHLRGIVSDSDVSQCLAGSATDGEDDAIPTAGQLMTVDVTSVPIDAAPLVVLEAMLRRGIHSVPVVEGRRLRGIVTSRDFLREYSELGSRTGRLPVARAMQPWRPTVERTASPDDALQLMQATGSRYIGITDGLRACGVLSKRQLGRARRLQWLGDESDFTVLESSAATLGDLLPEAAGIIDPRSAAGEAASKLHELRADGLAVVDAERRILGMLTLTGLLQSLSLELARRA
jgi:CBS domain-containing protein